MRYEYEYYSRAVTNKTVVVVVSVKKARLINMYELLGIFLFAVEFIS